MSKKKETTEFIKSFYKEIAAFAIEKGKTNASKMYSISNSAVDSALYMDGKPERCSKWYVKIRQGRGTKRGRPAKSANTKPAQVQEMTAVLKDDDAPAKIADSILWMLNDWKEAKEANNRLAAEILTLVQRVKTLESEIANEKKVINHVVLERARTALVSFGD